MFSRTLTRTWTRFHDFRLRLERHVAKNRRDAIVWECFLFIFKQGWACLFGAILLILILGTKLLWPAHAFIARYDFLFLAALTTQILLLVFRMETVREAKIILMFHVVGTLMELFKTSVGSWTYPEHNLIRIGHVPLFSGFMYASVGSYMARIARILDLRYTHFPKRWITAALAALIYINFFTHHYLPDIRIPLFLMLAFAFGRTWVYYRPYQKFRRMPLLFGFALVAFFIWMAENIGTISQVWLYPDQHAGWRMVHWGKYGAWFLLMTISFILVTFAHPPSAPPKEESQALAPGSLRIADEPTRS